MLVGERVDVLEAVRWAKGIEGVHRRIEAGFYRSEPRRRALDYLKELLSPVERKNEGNKRGMLHPTGCSACCTTTSGTPTCSR